MSSKMDRERKNLQIYTNLMQNKKKGIKYHQIKQATFREHNFKNGFWIWNYTLEARI